MNRKVAKVPGKSRGPAITLKVMAGDTIEISAKAFYNMDKTLPGKGVDIAPVVGTAIAAMTSPVGAVLDEAAQLALDLGAEASQSVALVGLPKEDKDEYQNPQPKSGINFVAYNEKFKLVPENTGVLMVEDNIHTIQTLATDRIIIRESGFLEVYAHNEAQTPVYFDNMTVSRCAGAALEVNAYYPYGMLNPGLSSSNGAAPNAYKYNAKELQKELNLNWLDYGARMMDPAVGRFMVPDRFAEKYYHLSPYQYAANNPINVIDINGDSTYFTNGKSAEAVASDLNSIFRNIFKIDYDVFSTETKSVSYTKTVSDGWFKTKKETVTEDRTYITTNSDFDWNTNKYTKAVFDLMNTTTQIEGVVVDKDTKIPSYLPATIGQVKGFADKDNNRFWLSNDLKRYNSSTPGNWSYGGTALHEMVNHFHYVGNYESNIPLQNFFGLPQSSLEHQGAVKLRWTPSEIERLNKLRSNTGKR